MTTRQLNKLEKYLEARIRARTIDGVWLSRKEAEKLLTVVRQFPRERNKP